MTTSQTATVDRYNHTQVAAAIRDELKKIFPKCKFSVRKPHYGMISISLMSAPFPVLRDAKCGHMQVNHFWIGNSKNDELFTRRGVNLLKVVCGIPAKYNWDNSDLMTDYFDVNFYLSVEVGKWDKPYALVK